MHPAPFHTGLPSPVHPPGKCSRPWDLGSQLCPAQARFHLGPLGFCPQQILNCTLDDTQGFLPRLQKATEAFPQLSHREKERQSQEQRPAGAVQQPNKRGARGGRDERGDASAPGPAGPDRCRGTAPAPGTAAREGQSTRSRRHRGSLPFPEPLIPAVLGSTPIPAVPSARRADGTFPKGTLSPACPSRPLLRAGAMLTLRAGPRARPSPSTAPRNQTGCEPLGENGGVSIPCRDRAFPLYPSSECSEGNLNRKHCQGQRCEFQVLQNPGQTLCHVTTHTALGIHGLGAAPYLGPSACAVTETWGWL
ncbi:collagen alpha-1(II) chain-like [Prinia subflava]|uniref:collagen alpha-1(II) chain-like n=1 Tax=Prinia subflava TaxID=208062 RepID=UPI002FE3A7D9